MEEKMRNFVLFLGLMFAASMQLAHAHADHGKPQHGGVVAEGGVFQAELVATATKLTVHVTDHGKPVDTKGATAKATLLVGKEKREVNLVASGGNRLEATGMFDVTKGTRVVAVVTLGGKSTSVRWTLK
jgi:hypothetical protein